MRRLGRIEIVAGAFAIALAMGGVALMIDDTAQQYGNAGEGMDVDATGAPNDGPKDPQKQDSSGPLSAKIGL